MTDHHTYGTSGHTVSELVRLVSDRCGLAFSERESSYRGIYHLADSPGGRIEIQPNPLPGDDGEDELYAPEHPGTQLLLLVTTPAADPTLQARLASVEGLAHLHHQSW